MTTGTLHLLCGKAASGKSCLARQLAEAPGTVMLAEEQWLAELFPWGISNPDDYQLYARRVRKVMGPHVVGLLRAGTSVVLDIPANTLADRRWLIDLAQQAGAGHCLHFLEQGKPWCGGPDRPQIWRFLERQKSQQKNSGIAAGTRHRLHLSY